MSQAGSPDIGSITDRTKVIEKDLQNLVQMTSVDFLGVSTRYFIDRLILACCIGFFIGVVGDFVDPIPIGWFKFNLAKTGLIPIAVLFAIVYYGAGVSILALLDYRRWSAIYMLQVEPARRLATEIQSLCREEQRQFEVFCHEFQAAVGRGSFLNEGDDVPNELRLRSSEVQGRVKAMSDMIQVIAAPGIRMQRQAVAQMTVFVALPILFAISALLLIANSMSGTF